MEIVTTKKQRNILYAALKKHNLSWVKKMALNHNLSISETVDRMVQFTKKNKEFELPTKNLKYVENAQKKFAKRKKRYTHA